MTFGEMLRLMDIALKMLGQLRKRLARLSAGFECVGMRGAADTIDGMLRDVASIVEVLYDLRRALHAERSMDLETFGHEGTDEEDAA